MSLKSTSGTSLIEVMVMMVIFSISIVGIYSMVNSGRELASLTDARLTAVNIAREGLESVATLRDTFALKGFEPGTCGGAPESTAFFSINEELLTSTFPINCPQIGQDYILQDDKKLVLETTNFEVCINEFGWYSQEQSMASGATLGVNCSAPDGVTCSCKNTLTLCGNNITQSCVTRFKRVITFKAAEACNIINDPFYCLEVFSTVTWGAEGADETLELKQVLTPLN